MSSATAPPALGLFNRPVRSGNSYYLPSPMLRPELEDSTQTHVKYILVTGGVCSSLGKGVTTSSIGALLKTRGYRVSSIKIDPYINVDAGLMSPFEHGEVYVLNDGGEVDLDLGNYERWMSVQLTRDHNITTGKVFKELIDREREGKYLGKTVQLVPHFTNEVVERIVNVSNLPVDNSGLKPHVCLIELGGTIGDLESAPFVEALRTLRFTLPPEDFLLVHCTYLPVMGGSQKTKPTQHSCRALLSLGLTPDFLVCRSDDPLDDSARAKLSQQCSIQEKYIIGAHNVANLYEVPVLFETQDMLDKLQRRLRLDPEQLNLMPPLAFPSLDTYKKFATTLANPSKTIRIAFVGKYTQGGSDAYFSVMQTFEHCCLALNVAIKFLWMDATLLETPEQSGQAFAALESCEGIFVPGGFGTRGIRGKVLAARFAREKNIPYLGVCLGMQVALIEFAQSQIGWEDATSEEFDTNKTSAHHVLRFMPEIDRRTMGANMRLGGREVNLIEPKSICKRIYGGANKVIERHRHRFEFNMSFVDEFKSRGLLFTGIDTPAMCPETRVECIELPSHKFFLGVQYHPEYRTAPNDPSPPFLAFVEAASGEQYPWPSTNSRKTA